MSHDITLASSSQIRGGLDLWQGGGALGAPVDPQASPLRKVHRLLRGRYGLAVTLGLIGGILGAGIGWATQKQQFSSTGLIQISPIVQSILNNDKIQPFYDKFVQSQPMVITSQRNIEAALASEQWRTTGLSSGPEMIPSFTSNLDAAYQKGTQLVAVTYTDPRPAIAQAGARAACQAYKAMYDDTSGQHLKENIDLIEAHIDGEMKKIEGNTRDIRLLAEQYGTDDLNQLQTAKQTKVLELDGKVTAWQMQMNQLKTPESPATELTVEQIAGMDPTMREYVGQVSAITLKIKMLKAQGIGENSRLIKDLEANISSFNSQMETYAASFRAQFGAGRIFKPDQMAFVPVSDEVLKAMLAALEDTKHLLADETEKLKVIGQTRVKIMRLKDEIGTSRNELDRSNRRYEERVAEASRTGTLSIITDGSTPIPSVDNRKKMAFVGFVVGAGLPIGVLLLIGLMDGRYRYSEEAGDDMAGMMLLGILPNLPDRLTDPDQAATAAHCVHQIRTMLQINGGDDRRAYCVTSASPGDGKTSLTLALGLSFAASGARTLLIDCDLVGGGLTARLDMAGPEGVLEAMANRALLEYIRTTDVPDLAMLPVGTAQPHHAGMFSPAALRRLVAEAKKHFEVVLIDTGPILGSIEATPVCAAADGVILTVSRTQQRSLVEKAMAHLNSIGAKFAGVVFNRAQHRDFERSVSGMSLRSVGRSHQTGNGNGNGNSSSGAGYRKGESQAIGPVARAVASSFRPPEEQ